MPSNSVFFQAWIWLAWTPNLLDSSATVPSSLIAASATFALNSGLCFFRVCDKSHLQPIGRSKAGLSLRCLSSFEVVSLDCPQTVPGVGNAPTIRDVEVRANHILRLTLLKLATAYPGLTMQREGMETLSTRACRQIEQAIERRR